MKLFRGCGLDGLVGMTPTSHIDGLTIFRPLLDIRRLTLRDYLRSIHQTWREDASNATPDYARNRLRNSLLPLIENDWPSAVSALCRTSRIADQSRRPLLYAAQNIWQTHASVARTNRRIEFPRSALQTWPILTAELLRRAIDHVGGTSEIADAERIDLAVRLIHARAGGKTVQMGRGVAVHIGKTVAIERAPVRASTRKGARSK
jgi:tRNA(Ile)-lysidine synthase